MIDSAQVIDFHAHVGRYDDIGMTDDPDLMLRAMDAAGIDQACVFNCHYADAALANDQTARFVAAHPDRFIGFTCVSPTMPELVVPELNRAFDELGFAAIKVYSPSTPWPLNQPQWDPIYQFANERRLCMIFHTGPDPRAHPRHLADIAPRFPHASFVAGHSGNVPEFRAQAIAAARACPNVFLETCSTYRTPGVIEQLVNEAGADRVLFGTDMPLMDPRAQIGKIITARISDEAKRQVLGDNARRLLRMD